MDDSRFDGQNQGVVKRLLWPVMAVTSGAYAFMALWALGQGLADPAALLWLLFVVPLVAAVGVIPLWKRPQHPIGRLLIGVVIAMFMIPSLVETPTVIRFRAFGIEPWMWAPIWISMTFTMVAAVLLSTLIVLLPDGHIRYARERWFLWTAWVLVLAPALSLVSNQVILKYEQTFPGLDDVASPYTIEALVPYGAAVNQAGLMLAGLVFTGAMLLQILRYRRAPVRERKQVRWVIFATSLAVVIGLIPTILVSVDVMDPLGHSLAAGLWSAIPIILIPSSVVVAVLEPPWVDVDIVIRKSFVYGALSFVILLLYVGVAAALGVAAGSRLSIELAVVLTVVVAVLFQPARQRLQLVADRWVFGVRPTRFEAVSELSESIEQAGDPTALLPQLVETVRKALRVEWVIAELDDGSRADTGPATGQAVISVPIEAGDEEIGHIDCGPKIEGSLGEDEIQLLNTLARQVGLAVTNARLAGRIVTAAEAERRRIERNIHDGAQQELVALVARLGMARSSAAEGQLSPAELDELQYEARRILTDLRELAQGIHPSVLTDGGLLEAVEERCSRLPLEVTVDASPGLREERFGDDIEGAAYFFVTEALTNVLKHAEASNASVSIHRQGGRLRVEVTDDGGGFEPDSVRRNGLDGLRDRIRALGGTMTIRSRPAGGTTVTAALPATS
ncbi:MAG: ATP-binding protein [Acidimicrobiia bacterium]